MKARLRKIGQKIVAIVKYELHANATPLRAAVSLSVGILFGFSPFYGFQTITLLPIAYIFRLNRPLSLLGTGITVLPVVPLWIAAGIFTGKLVIPLSLCNWIIETGYMLFSETGIGHLFCSIMHFSMKVLPRELFVSLHADKAQDIGAALVQWALGSSVFAIVSAMITLAVTYPLFLQIVKERTKKNL